jgi:hypothetical protein
MYFMLANLADLVDVESSQCQVEEDRIREMAIIREQFPGEKNKAIETINRAVVGVVRGASTSLRKNVMEVDAFVTGEEGSLLCLLRLELGRINTRAGRSRLMEVLSAAASGGRTKVVATVLHSFDQAGSALSSEVKRSVVDDSKALWRACRGGHCQVSELLLVEGGGDVDVLGTGNSTPLWIAASHGDEVTVRMLLRSGADVDAIDDNGCSPIRIAQMMKHKGTVAILNGAGADVEDLDDDVYNEEGPIVRISELNVRSFFLDQLGTLREEEGDEGGEGGDERKSVRKRFSQQSTNGSVSSRSSLRSKSALMRLSSEITDEEINKIHSKERVSFRK